MGMSKARQHHLEGKFLANAVARAGQERKIGVGVSQPYLIRVQREQPARWLERVWFGPEAEVTVSSEDGQGRRCTARDSCTVYGECALRSNVACQKRKRGPQAERFAQHCSSAFQLPQSFVWHGADRSWAADAAQLGADGGLFGWVARELVGGPGEEAAGRVLPGEEERGALVDDDGRRAAG